LAEKLCILHQWHIRISPDFFECNAPAKEPVIAKSHAQEKAGVMSEGICQSINNVPTRDTNTKETANS
jgi:hypothetical protein